MELTSHATPFLDFLMVSNLTRGRERLQQRPLFFLLPVPLHTLTHTGPIGHDIADENTDYMAVKRYFFLKDICQTRLTF